MTTELSTFKPETVEELVSELRTQLANIASNWWKSNSQLVEGYLKSLAESVIQTQVALEMKKISPESADILLHNQELAFNQVLRFTEFMTLVLAQKLLDTVFAVVGWVIYNKTGVNLFPALVKT
jgi:hypothetical protein